MKLTTKDILYINKRKIAWFEYLIRWDIDNSGINDCIIVSGQWKFWAYIPVVIIAAMYSFFSCIWEGGFQKYKNVFKECLYIPRLYAWEWDKADEQTARILEVYDKLIKAN